MEAARDRPNKAPSEGNAAPYFSHRARAAARAISARFSGDKALARALPPTLPPLRPSATAWGFFLGGFSAVLSATIIAARLFGSEGRFLLERLGIGCGCFTAIGAQLADEALPDHSSAGVGN